jgi:hypothetical protein
MLVVCVDDDHRRWRSQPSHKASMLIGLAAPGPWSHIDDRASVLGNLDYLAERSVALSVPEDHSDGRTQRPTGVLRQGVELASIV